MQTFNDWLMDMFGWALATDLLDEDEPVETPKEVSEEVVWSGSSTGTD